MAKECRFTFDGLEPGKWHPVDMAAVAQLCEAAALNGFSFRLEFREPEPVTQGERPMPGCECGAARRGDFDRCRCD